MENHIRNDARFVSVHALLQCSSSANWTFPAITEPRVIVELVLSFHATSSGRRR
jgi:hypothetical protein